MENFRERRLERQVKSLQGTSIVIAVILLLSIVGNVFLFVRNSSVNNEKEELLKEKNLVASDKDAAEESNRQLKAEIEKLSGQIDAIKENAAALEEQIQARDARLARLRGQVAEIEQLRLKVAELDALKEEFEKLEQERQNLLAELQTISLQLSGLQNQHQTLLDKVEEATYLKAYNICVHNHRDRWLGRPVTMELAGRVNRTTVSFEINGNLFVETGPKNVHVVMVDSRGNVVKPSAAGFTISGTGESSNYTEFSTVQYNHKSLPLSFTIIHEEKLEPGNFRMDVYIDGLRAGSKEFVLE